MRGGYTEFEFDLPESLLRNLIEAMDETTPAQLNTGIVKDIPDEQGVYQLLLDDRVVYIGKTDAEAGLHKRLSRHCKKILHRQNLDPGRVSFKAVRIFVFTAIDLETALIRHYGGVAGLDWNGSGFGSNDPGRRRDKTIVDPRNYDAQYPLDIDREIAYSIDEGETADVAAARLKEALPYTFRYQSAKAGGRVAHDDFRNTELSSAQGPMTARQAVVHIVNALPSGWQATGLSGYVVLYKENEEYPAAEIICRS
jgi:hypothetical protein